MAVELAAPRPRARARTLPFGFLAAVPAWLWLGCIVAASFGTRLILALQRATPLYIPDEYIYSSLARSLAESGKPLIRGGPAHFPALLEPLLAAPFWLTGDTALAYRLTQAENVLAMSLAAVPVYLLCRRLGLRAGFSVAAGLLAVAGPDLLYASFVVADPIAYLLVLSAICVGVGVLDRPTRGGQVAFLALSGLATFARVQYVFLPVAFLAAALIVERGRLRRALKPLRLTVCLVLAPVLLAFARGPSRVLGYYSNVAHLHVGPSILHWAGTDLMLLAYSSGWVLVPGAVVGFGLALLRPRTRAEAAFGALVLAVAGALLLEAGLYATNGSHRFQERYLITLLPLVAPAFGVYVKRGWPARRGVVLASLGLLVLSARIPLSGFTIADAKQDSPFLLAVFRLEQHLGIDNGSLAVALLAAALSAVACALGLARRGAPLALGLAVTVAVVLSGASFLFDHANAKGIAGRYSEHGLAWVDSSGLENVTIVQTQGADRAAAMEQLFWNRSIDRVGLLFGGISPDAFGADSLTVSPHGRIVRAGRILRGPFLFDDFALQPQFTGAVEVARAGEFRLYRPDGIPRLSLLTFGRYHDGWLARGGEIRVWPDAWGRTRGMLRFGLTLPPNVGAEPTPLRLRAPGLRRTVLVRPGRVTTAVIPIDARGVWSLDFSTTKYGRLSDGRPISVQSTEPKLSRTPAGPPSY